MQRLPPPPPLESPAPMHRGRGRFALLCICATLGGLGAVKVARAASDPASPYRKLDVFSHVLSLIQNNYVEDVDDAKLLYGAIDGMVRTLDPHSTFMDPKAYAALKQETDGEYGGVGLEIATRGDDLVVVSPVDDSPAARAGVAPGDRLLEIDGAQRLVRAAHVHAGAGRHPRGLRRASPLRPPLRLREDQELPGSHRLVPEEGARCPARAGRRPARRRGTGPAPQPRWAPGPGGEGGGPLPGRGCDRDHQGTRQQARRGGARAREGHRAGLSAHRAGRRGYRERQRDRGRRAAGPRPGGGDGNRDL